MPLYVYRCEDCARSFEVFAKVAREKPDAEGCCWCGSENVTKQPTTASFKLKGAGFHANDYPK